MSGVGHAGLVGPVDLTAALAGCLALITGLAYTGLGIITAYELMQRSRPRGHWHFGFAFLLMAATCGPHHLVHATHHLLEGEPAGGSMLAALTVGVLPGAVFILLRMEAAFGGRGDRHVSGTPLALAALPWVLAMAAGAILLGAFERAGERAPDLLGVAPNAVLFAAYGLVGAFTFRTQLARRPGLGGWSLSGLAMSGVFATCGLSHLVAGLTLPADVHSAAFDLPGVPAAVLFLVVVHRLHRESLREWNRRPLVGRAARRSRPSPWASDDLGTV